MVKMEVSHVFLKFGSQFHCDFFCQVRGLQRAHFGENRMFGSHPVLQLRFKTVSTNQIARFFKLQSGISVPISNLNISGMKGKSKSVWIFRKSKEGTFLMLYVKFHPSSFLHPENRDRQSGSQIGPNLHLDFFSNISFVSVVELFWIFLSSARLQWANSSANRMFRISFLLELWLKRIILNKGPKVVKK